MFLVENFRIFLLVGLICTLGIDPARAEKMCNQTSEGGAAKACADDTHHCGIKLDDGTTACVAATNCQDKVGAEFTDCEAAAGDKTHCCCTAVEDKICNNLNDMAVKEKVCMDKILMNVAPLMCSSGQAGSTAGPMAKTTMKMGMSTEGGGEGDGSGASGIASLSIGTTILLASLQAYLRRDVSHA